MPELPEVQTVVDYIRKDLLEEEIMHIDPVWPKVLHNFDPEDLFQTQINTRILDVKRRAKFIIIQLPDHLIAIHLRMTGKLHLLQGNELPKHVTALIRMKSGKTLVFNDVRKFGRLYLYETMGPIDSCHGPEPLDESFSSDLFINLMVSRKRNIKGMLLDQSVLAGLGNIYVDESLWMSGIHPGSISSAVPKTRLSKLHKSIRLILSDAIIAKGTTIIDFSVNGESGKYSDQLRVFGKDGKPCLKCGHTIKKMRVGGRGTYICKKCQLRYIKPRY